MFKLFASRRSGRIWDFSGGIYPPEMKTRSNGVPLRRPPLAEKFIIPLKQHLGPEGELCVTAGDRVLRGQPLTEGRGRTLPVHAPTSGTVQAIAPHITAHPSALAELSVILLPDGEDRWCQRQPESDYRQRDAGYLLNRIHQAGIAGLGGAGFPTAAKLQGGLGAINTLIINAAECEPYITADDRLMQEQARQIVDGIDVLVHILRPDRVIIGIEDNKPAAAKALAAAIDAGTGYQLRVVPTKYPSGGAKQLTKILTGREVPFGRHSAAIGIVMLNVGTVFAIKRAIIDGEPLTERVVTLTGDALSRPGNVWGRLGTPVSHLLRDAGFTPEPEQLVIMGGPLMGFTLPALDVPIVKISNCVMAPSGAEVGKPAPEQSCIRCSLCADACPAGLLPQQLYWFSRGQEHEKARGHHLADCIECGACAYVCPSNIPLVRYYRQEKAEIRALDLDAARAQAAKARFEAKQARREREKLAREARHSQAAVRLDARDEPMIKAALGALPVTDAGHAAPAPASVAATPDPLAMAALPALGSPATPLESLADDREAPDPRKAAVAAAIARVKARKAVAGATTELHEE
ncbi:electron transport complex subunit RsxC [Enterobacteriales bacterium SAP-6]|uniref:Ion-translocating oxidoreductase complex subunit C n=1 Tax=Acerihabitans arboris TaxID=2691583 RepID=A0A845SE90_9GAMM|nr:electron transport complex subunit RsxC [Acerihabitans arboris]